MATRHTFSKEYSQLDGKIKNQNVFDKKGDFYGQDGAFKIQQRRADWVIRKAGVLCMGTRIS
jgi:hypothetical protein